MLRHPGNGKLVWASRLPFGYIDSPRLFCGVTEMVAQLVRARAAREGKGIHIFVFVDDYLCVGDTKELTELGCQWLEEEFAKRGMQWAPHKKRGPCRCIEFLGLNLGLILPSVSKWESSNSCLAVLHDLLLSQRSRRLVACGLICLTTQNQPGGNCHGHAMIIPCSYVQVVE